MDEVIVSSAVAEELRAAGSEVSKQVPALLKLGKLYLKRAKATADGGDFTKSGGLFNAALVRSRLVENGNDGDEILQEISETYREFLLAFAHDKRISEDEIQTEVRSHKKWIADERRNFKERVDKIDSSFNRNDENEDQYEVFINFMIKRIFGRESKIIRLQESLWKVCTIRLYHHMILGFCMR